MPVETKPRYTVVRTSRTRFSVLDRVKKTTIGTFANGPASPAEPRAMKMAERLNKESK